MGKCLNPLCIQNHNVVYQLNSFFAKNPNSNINCKQFMEIQNIIWKKVKKELGIKIG